MSKDKLTIEEVAAVIALTVETSLDQTTAQMRADQAEIDPVPRLRSSFGYEADVEPYWMDDLVQYNQNEADDYRNEGGSWED